MSEIVINAIGALISIVLIIIMIKDTRKIKDPLARNTMTLYLVFSFTLILVFWLDVYNIPTKFKYIRSMDTNRWFDFIGNLIIGVLSATLSGIILFWVTRKQIKVQLKENNDNKRIQNAPIFDYELLGRAFVDCKYNYELDSGENGELYFAYLKIENIGLSHSKNVGFMVDFDNKKGKKFFLNRCQSFIKKDETIWILFSFKFNKQKKGRSITINVFYEDMINNCYVQKIKAIFIPHIDDDDSRVIFISDCNINNAQLVKKDGE